MYFTKIHQPENFAFPTAGQVKRDALTIGKQTYPLDLEHMGGDVHRFAVKHRIWPKQHSQVELAKTIDLPATANATFAPRTGLSLGAAGKTLLQSEAGRCFGVSGNAWLMAFEYDKAMRFYGMGEKTLGIEYSGKFTKFWNTDVWADFDGNAFVNGRPDPMYLSIPYLIVKRGNQYVGILVNNPHAVFMSLNPTVSIAEQAKADDDGKTRFFIGAPDGKPEVYFIVGPTLAELTRKLQLLVGTTPLPPLWALGHHQSRWGYASYDDLDRLDKHFTKHEIPNDGLWLDIDYMTGYRVFTWNKKHWKNPAKLIENLHRRRQHVVPIFDPGVKCDPEYDVYQSGLKNDVFCQNPAGTPYVGFVWPGTTAFPDFSIPEGRRWWADHVSEAAKLGLTGCWLDMNDPATGLSENSEMLFDHGKKSHDTYHNQYALGMAKATWEGLRNANPDDRPFILTRSGFTGINRYAAAWTGDNFSNVHHLKTSIPTTLNLALSGLPFNGPDVPGFGGDATPSLAVAWYKACFLFPFFRNHSNKGGCVQEPWSFNPATTRTLRRYIRLRYKLLPYLYNLFAQHEETGEAIIRPLLYDFNDFRTLPLDQIDDQFMIGPSLMQAPVTDPELDHRQVALPRGQWFNALTGKWIAGHRQLKAKAGRDQTPLFVRDGSIIPMRPGTPKDNRTDLSIIDLHLFLSKEFKGTARYTYHADDGASYAYRRGLRTTVDFEIQRKKGGITAKTTVKSSGYGPVKIRFVIHSNEKAMALTLGGKRRDVAMKPGSAQLTGPKLAVSQSPVLTIG